MEDWKNVILFLLSPAYLLPALIGYVFFTATRNTKIIEPEVIKELKRFWRRSWTKAKIELHPFWGEKPEHSLFLLPIVNVYFLIRMFLLFWRCKRFTNEYLRLYSGT